VTGTKKAPSKILGTYIGFEVATSVSSRRYTRIKPLTKIWSHLRLRTLTALHPFLVSVL
jgi:hypothetical protein